MIRAEVMRMVAFLCPKAEAIAKQQFYHTSGIGTLKLN